MAAAASQKDQSFFWRKLHSLTGIIPVGAYLVDHLWSNSYALVGVNNYNHQSQELQSVPWRLPLEIAIIWAPIAYHSLYGFYVWSRGRNNVSAYPWVGNWMYTIQRWTGLLAFLFIGWHLYDERFRTHGMSTYNDVYVSMQNAWFFAFYLVGVTAACVHFGVGIWNFLCKWGLAATKSSQRAAGWLGFVVGAALVVMSLTIIISFRYGWHPLNGYISQAP